MTKTKTELTPTEREEFQPFDIEVEQGLLGAIMVDNRLLAVAMADVVADDFYDSLHAALFERMILFDEDQRPITPLTLGSAVKNILAKTSDHDFDVRDYLRGLYTHAPEDPQIPAYCRIILDHAERRQARQVVNDAAERLWRGDMTTDALAHVVEVSDKIALRVQHARGSGDVEDAFHRLSLDVEKAANGGELAGCTTGLRALDLRLGGYMPSDLVIMAGRPGMGKSVLACHAAKTAGELTDGRDRLYDPTIFSLEMSSKENVARLIAEIDYPESIKQGRKPLQYTSIVKGRLSGDEFERFVLIGQMLQDLGIKIYDEGRMTVAKIGSLARARAQISPRKPFVIVDNIQIVGIPEGFRGSRLEALTEITGGLKALAKRLDAPVVALSHLNRGVETREDKRPNLGDLRESGSIEQDADAVMFLYRPEYYLRTALKHARAVNAKNTADLELQEERSRNVLEIDVAKNRSGGTGEVKVFIDVASNYVGDKRPEASAQGALGLTSEPLDRLGLDDLDRRSGA